MSFWEYICFLNLVVMEALYKRIVNWHIFNYFPFKERSKVYPHLRVYIQSQESIQTKPEHKQYSVSALFILFILHSS